MSAAATRLRTQPEETPMDTIPTPRTPDDGWVRCGRYEVRLDDVKGGRR